MRDHGLQRQPTGSSCKAPITRRTASSCPIAGCRELSQCVWRPHGAFRLGDDALVPKRIAAAHAEYERWADPPYMDTKASKRAALQIVCCFYRATVNTVASYLLGLRRSCPMVRRPSLANLASRCVQRQTLSRCRVTLFTRVAHIKPSRANTILLCRCLYTSAERTFWVSQRCGNACAGSHRWLRSRPSSCA